MKRLVLSSGLNQGWVLINVLSSGDERMVMVGEIVNKKIAKNKFSYDIESLAELLNDIEPDEILFECDDNDSKLTDLLKFYEVITGCKVNFFPVEWYYIYMGVKYHTLTLPELLNVGEVLFPHILVELAYHSNYAIRPVLMNHCYNKYERID